MSSATHGSPKQVCRVQQPCWKVGSCNTPPVSCVGSSHRGDHLSEGGPPDLSLWGREGWLSMGSPCRTTGYSQAESVVVVLPRGCVAMNMGTSFGNVCLKAACSLHHPIPSHAWCAQDRNCQGVGGDPEQAVSHGQAVIHPNSWAEYGETWLLWLAMEMWQDSCAALGRDRLLGAHSGAPLAQLC